MNKKEEIMREAPESEEMTSLWWNRPVIYWQKDQVVLTFHSPLEPTEGIERVIASLKLNVLERFLHTNGFTLQSFTAKDVPHPGEDDRKEADRFDDADEEVEANPKEDGQLESSIGKYLFASPSGHGTTIICFFHGNYSASASTMPGSNMARGSMADATQALVTQINQNLDKLRQDGEIPIIAAMPNWIGGGTQKNEGPVGHGCPVSPPVPVSGNAICASGSWHYSLPELSNAMQEMSGNGVRVFVLDTIPELDQIRSAGQDAGNANLLLQDMVAHMDSVPPSPFPPPIMPPTIIIDHQWVPKRITTNIQTGKDVYQRLYGFHMPDHGLFVAGIIHDLAPKASIECIRVLNDSGIGDFGIICEALWRIQQRMMTDELGQVVVNLSLVISPPDEEIASLWFGDDCCHASDAGSMISEIQLLRLGLHTVIQSLTAQGAIVVASSGNESNANAAPSMSMGMGTPAPTRLGPRYPAAFPEVISVGAVDGTGKATFYSDYPALPPNHNGIATYGGLPPTPHPPVPTPHVAPTVTVSDEPVGLYSSQVYPPLSAAPPSVQYLEPNTSAWAYWAGTSFATPIISALAARVLEGLHVGVVASSDSVQDIITTGSGQQAILSPGTILKHNTAFGVGISVLKAVQKCEP
jgi:hypothetical protein